MNIKCDVIVDELLIQDMKFFYSLKQCQPSSFILSKCLCQIKPAYRGVEGGVTNEDIIGVSVTGFFIQSSQDAFEDFP